MGTRSALRRLVRPLCSRWRSGGGPGQTRRGSHVGRTSLWGCSTCVENCVFCVLPCSFSASRPGGSNSREKPQRSFTELRPTKCCCPVRTPDWPRRGAHLVFAAAAYQASRCSSVSDSFWLQTLEASRKTVRERCCAGVRGSLGTT